MEEQKVDRRVKKTKKALLNSLTKLMSEKKLNNITIKELTDLADVNRSTFYLYYKDIFDMVEQIESEMIENITKAFKKISKTENIYTDMLSFYTYLFENVQENAEMCKILLGPDGNYGFIEKIKKIMLKTKPPFDESAHKIKIHYLRPYFILGCIGILQQWIKDDFNISPKELAALTVEIIEKSASIL